MATVKGLTIGQVARHAGLPASTIRFYEDAGVLPEPARVSGWRRYDAGVFAHLAMIALAQDAGFSLDEIRTLRRGFPDTTPPSARWATLARKKLPEVEALIARAQAMKRLLSLGIECGCHGIEDCSVLAERVHEMSRGAPHRRRPGRAGKAQRCALSATS